MRPRLSSIGLSLAGALLLVAPRPASAYIGIAMQPIPEIVVMADVLAVGTITTAEGKPIRATVYPDRPAMFEMRVFELTATEVLRGDKAKTYRVAVPQMEAWTRPMTVTIDGKTRRLNPEIKVGAKGAFVLVKHRTEDLYVVPNLGGFFAAAAPDHPKEVAFLRRNAALLNDPAKGLEAKGEEDRFLTAYMLAYDYGAKPARMAATKGTAPEPASAEQSRRILEILLASNWDGPANQIFKGPFTPVYPFHVVQRLQLDEVSMKGRPAIGALATDENIKAYRRWLEGVRDTARIQRLVAK